MTRVMLSDLNKMLNLFEKSTIGFNRVVPSVMSSINSTFPPTNIVKVGDGEYLVELAVAGFSREDISVSIEDNILTMEGSKKEQEDRDYLYNGIAARHFKRELPIANGIEVKSATMKDGILTVALSYKSKAKMIEVI